MFASDIKSSRAFVYMQQMYIADNIFKTKNNGGIRVKKASKT